MPEISEVKKSIRRIVKLLEEYKLLENNWDEEGAIAPIDVALKKCLYLTRTLNNIGQPIFHAAPGPNGEIMIDLRNRKNTRSLEIIFYKDRSVYVLFPTEEMSSQCPFEFKKLPDLLNWLNSSN